jgi:hypothetical protein
MSVALGTIASHRTAPVAAGLPMTGLQLWLDADDASTFTYNGGRVSEWRDKSGNNRHAALAASGPIHDGVINGRAAVRFDLGVTAALTITAFAASYTAAELFVVIDITTENSGAYFGLWGTATDFSHYPTGGVIYESWGTTVRKTVGNPVTDVLNPHIYNLQTAANYYAARINSEALFSTATNTVGFRATPYEIPMSANCPVGLMGEFVMYDRVLSAGDRTAADAYLRTKWGIA